MGKSWARRDKGELSRELKGLEMNFRQRFEPFYRRFIPTAFSASQIAPHAFLGVTWACWIQPKPSPGFSGFIERTLELIWPNFLSTFEGPNTGSFSVSSSSLYQVWYPVTPAMGRTQFDGPECIKEIKLKPEKSNSISDFFSRKGTPVKSSVHETCEAGTDEDQSEIIADHLSVDEQKAFLAGLEPDTEVTKEALPCINEERNLEQCVTKRSFENKDKKGLDSLENETEPKASISNPPIDPSNESGSNRIYSPDLQMKKRSKIHAAGDKQKTLLSYFGRS